jgi:hypothetical protein
MERFFQITAVILIGIAVFFWWQGNTDGLFISTVLGAVSFFLSVRFQVKDRLRQREAEREEEEFKGKRQKAKGKSEIEDRILNEQPATDNEQRTIDKEQV